MPLPRKPKPASKPAIKPKPKPKAKPKPAGMTKAKAKKQPPGNVQLTPSGNERLKLAPLPEDFRSDQLPQILEKRGMPQILVEEAAERERREEQRRRPEGTAASPLPRARALRKAPALETQGAMESVSAVQPEPPMPALGLAELEVTDARTAAFEKLSANLSRVEEPAVYPWSAHVRLFMDAPDGSTRVGSGWIIGQHTIITAGHCVYDGGWMKNIRVRLAVSSNDSDKEMKASFWNTTTQWKSGATTAIREAGDVGVVRVNESLTDSTPPLRYACYSEERIKQIIDQKRAVSVAGFPLDPWNSFMVDAGVMTEKNAEHLLYDVETFEGQSGAPLLFWDEDEQPTVIGVHHWNVALNRNRAVRINQPTAALLLNWAS